MPSCNYKGNYINGSWQIPQKGEVLEVVSPADKADTVFCGFCEVSVVEAAVQSATQAFKKVWRKNSIEQRCAYLEKLIHVYERRQEEVGLAISRETGKALWESQQEARLLAAKVKTTLSEALKLVEDQSVDQKNGMESVIHYRPKGVLAVIGPFNFPAHLPNGHFIPALLTGNTIVFKPSDKAPYTGQLLAEMVAEAGFPAGVFNLIQGRVAESRSLVEHSLVDGVLFTGSYEVGKHIQQTLLEQPSKTLALEMGGKNASIVWKDADLKQASYQCAVGAFITAGQRCSCSSLIFVHEDVYDEFQSQFLEWVDRIQVGEPSNDVFYSAVVSESAVQSYFEAEKKALACGGQILRVAQKVNTSKKGYYLAPSVVSMPYQFQKEYHGSEYFCPHTALHKAGSDLESICDFVNETGYGLVASVFSKSEQIYKEALLLLKVGLCNWNCPTVGASGKMPFGGLGKSGNDHPSGQFAVYYCTTPVACMKNTGEFTQEQIHKNILR